MVESVIGFEAQFEVPRFVDVDSLLQRQVAVIDSRTIQRVAFGRAQSPGSRNRESRRIEVKVAAVGSGASTARGMSRIVVSGISNAQGSAGEDLLARTREEPNVIVASVRIITEVEYANRSPVLHRVDAGQVPVVG